MAAHGDYTPGSMDISAHQKMWVGFTAFVKWSTFFLAAVMLGLAIFRTHG